MSLRRLIRSQGKTPASRFPRPFWLILSLLAVSLSAVIADLLTTRRIRQSRLLHKGILCRLELGLYHMIIVPLIAFLPAPLAYGLACLQGNLRYYLDREKRQYILEGLEGVMGDQMSVAERIRVTRDFFRISSCEAVDAMRLAGNGQALKRLVEIRGMEHLETALAAGKGVILGTPHFGSYTTSFAFIGSLGFPITVIGRTPSRLNKNRTPLERVIFRLFLLNFVARHWRRPAIEPRGQLESAVQAAKILRNNELIGTHPDAPVLPGDRKRGVLVAFLNKQALLLPGATTLAQVTGAPLLMMFLYRSPDWRHQVLEILPPLSMEGDAVTVLKRCVAVMEDAIRQYPSHWHYWGKFALMDLGLLPEQSEPVLERS